MCFLAGKGLCDLASTVFLLITVCHYILVVLLEQILARKKLGIKKLEDSNSW